MTINQTRSGSSATPLAVTVPNVQKNSLLVVVAGVSSGQTISSVSDGTNSYNNLIAHTTNQPVYVYYAEVATAGSYTVTITGSVASTVKGIIREYANVPTGSADQTKSSSAGSGTALTSTATSALAVPSALVIGAGAVGNASATISLGTGYSNLLNINGGNISLAIEDAVVYSTTGVTATFTSNTSTAWSCAAVTFDLNPSPKARSIKPHPFSPGTAR